MSQIVDATINLRGHIRLPFYQNVERFSASRERGRKQWTRDTLITALDEAGIDKAGVIASVAAMKQGHDVDAIHVDEVQAVIENDLDRLFGWVGINPLTTMETLRYLDYAVGELGFKAAHVYPHWFGVRIDDRKYWPIYAKCAELEIPLAIQVGRQTPRSNAQLLAKPSWLDAIAFDFPELKLLGLHIGIPWTEEMIAMCQAWEHVYILADAHSPKHWDRSLVDYLSGTDPRYLDGMNKVIWGSDWPIQGLAQSLSDLDALGLQPDAKANLAGRNALRVFDL